MKNDPPAGKKPVADIKPRSGAVMIPPGSIVSSPDPNRCLDPLQLHRLEQSFRFWAKENLRRDILQARRRILIIFLLIRYTGAKLSEVLGVDPFRDIDFQNHAVQFSRRRGKQDRLKREVHLPEAVCREIHTLIQDPAFNTDIPDMLDADPGFVRRKFYERAEASGLPRHLGAPECLRKSRAVELMQGNMPLPAVQVMMGHSTPNLTSAYVSFSEEDIREVSRLFMEKESSRRTSARNSFFGKIQAVRQGDIQSLVELMTIGGHKITTVITNDSLLRLGLKVGKLITAEVKAPWVMLHKGGGEIPCSADNMFEGIVERVLPGEINTEYLVRLPDGTVVCSLVTSQSARRLGLWEKNKVRVSFNSFSVVLLSH